jgi:hypothetical protein
MKKDGLCALQSTPEASSPPEASEVYELFLAELVARRERLQQLLRMVAQEAMRGAVAPEPSPTRNRCRRAASGTA